MSGEREDDHSEVTVAGCSHLVEPQMKDTLNHGQFSPHLSLSCTPTVYHISHTALPLTVLYVTYSPAPAPHCVDGLSLHSCYVVPSCQHCVDGIPAVEALHVSDRHIVALHVNSPLEKRRGEEGKRHLHCCIGQVTAEMCVHCALLIGQDEAFVSKPHK